MTRPWPATIEYAPWSLPLRRPIVVAADSTPLIERRGVLLRVQSSDPDRPQPAYSDACPLPGLSRDRYDDVIAAIAAGRDGPSPPSLDWARYVTHCWSDTPCLTPTALLLGDGGDADDDVFAGLDALDVLQDGGTVKLKVGRRALADDLARVAAVVDVVRHKRGRLRLDGNRRLDVDAAVALSDVARSTPGVLEFFEEPVIVSKQKLLPSSVPLALDEWFDELHLRGGIRKVPKTTAWVIKPTVLGADATLEIVRAAMTAKIAVVVSSAYESAVGRQSLACFARSIDTMLRRSDVVHGLGTGPAFGEDLDLGALSSLSWRRTL